MAHLDFNIFVVKNIAQVQPIPVLSKRTKISIKMSYYPAFLSIYCFAGSRSQLHSCFWRNWFILLLFTYPKYVCNFYMNILRSPPHQPPRPSFSCPKLAFTRTFVCIPNAIWCGVYVMMNPSHPAHHNPCSKSSIYHADPMPQAIIHLASPRPIAVYMEIIITSLCHGCHMKYHVTFIAGATQIESIRLCIQHTTQWRT